MELLDQEGWPSLAVRSQGMMRGMSMFRHRPRRDPSNLFGLDLAGLSDRELIQQYRALSSEVDADEDPRRRAAEKDQLAAEVLRRHPSESAFWYDRGMYAKWRADWPASLEYNRKALDLLPPDGREGEPAAWNLGIAATALQEWATARLAWTAFGIPLPQVESVEEPIEADFGPAPVRLNAEPRFIGQELPVVDGRTWATEVVWGRRICPARIRIVNVPSPDSGHRYGDVVLHDGDTLGSRRMGEHELGVFNELGLCWRSPTPTLTVTVQAPDQQAAEELSDLFDRAGGAAEDWTQNLRPLCRACSEGSPGARHDHDTGGSWDPSRAFGLSADLAPAGELLVQWAASGHDRSFADLGIALA